MIKYSSNYSLSEFKSIIVSLIISYTIIIAFNFILIQYPLTNLLGYEFSALNSLLLTILSGIFTIHWIKKHYFLSLTLFAVLISFLVLPFIIIIIYSLITSFCSFSDGILFYSVITIPSVFIGLTLGLFVTYISDRYQLPIFLIIILLLVIIPVCEIYIYPQVYFYNPLITYFPGTIYDEALSVSWSMILYRIINLSFACFVLYLVLGDTGRKHKLRNTTGIIFSAAVLIFLSPRLGFTTDYRTLNDLLPNKVDSDNIILHLPESFPEDQSNLIQLHAQYYFQSLKESVKELPAKKMEIFLFENREQKKKYFGSGNADVAKPWLYQVYLSRESWHNTLKHEMAHIFSAEFGSTVFKLADWFNPFLIEGFAASQDPFRDELHIDYLSGLAFLKFEELQINHLLEGFNFFGTNSSLTYTYAGSFSKYLIDSFGISKFKEFYSNVDFLKVYGMSSDSIISGFRSYLQDLDIVRNDHRANYYFGRLSIIQKVCPRSIGNLLRRGWEHVENAKIDDAKSVFTEVLNKTPNYSAIIGLAECYETQDSISEAITLIEKSIDSFNNSPFYYHLNLKLADLYSIKSDYAKALKLYSELSHQKPSISIDIFTQLRIKLLENNIIRDFLLAEKLTKYNILVNLNKTEYFYPSIPVLIKYAESTGQDYNQFIKIFNKTKFVTDFYSSYAIYKLSEHMIMNYDFKNARKMAALSKRYREMDHFNLLLQDNFDKADWFYYNAEGFLQQFTTEQKY